MSMPFALRAITYISFALLLSRFVPSFFWIQELLKQDGFFLLLVFFLNTVGVFAYRKAFGVFSWLMLQGVTLFGFFYFLQCALPFFLPRAAPQGESMQHAVSFIFSNRGAEITALLGSSGSDEVVSSTFEQYPYQVSAPGSKNKSMRLYSQFPIANDVVTDLGQDLGPVIIAPLQISHDEQCLVALMQMVPGSSRVVLDHNYLLMRRTLSFIRQDYRCAIVAGDIWFSPFSGNYGLLETGGKVTNALYGYGFVYFPQIFRTLLALDPYHAFVKGGMTVEQVQMRASDTLQDFSLQACLRW